MKFNVAPLLICFILTGCLGNKKNKGQSQSFNDVQAPSTTAPIIQGEDAGEDIKPENEAGDKVDAPLEAKFCKKGHSYKIALSVDKDLMDHEGKKLKNDVPVYIHFQEGDVVEKSKIDPTKSHCKIRARINVRNTHVFTHKYKIFGEIQPQTPVLDAEGLSHCSQELTDLPKRKNGQGYFDEISCAKLNGNNVKVADVKDALGDNVMILE
jgi:hypothetical protein